VQCLGAGTTSCGDLNGDGCLEWGPVAACPAGTACSNGACGTTCTDVACADPPASVCVDASTLRSYAAIGTCSLGACAYPPTETACANGCSDGACAADACDPSACLFPPDEVCVSATVLRQYDAGGSCLPSGGCSFTHEDMACANGCSAGACNPGPCDGVTCDEPDDPVCVNATTLRTYAATGTCENGSCAYAHTDHVCAAGCADGECLDDPCAAVACNKPPQATCVDHATRRTYAPTGTCAGGACTYAPIDTACPSGTGCGASGGAANTCNACAVTTCGSVNQMCGSHTDSCGNTTDCGSCDSGEFCTAAHDPFYTVGHCCTLIQRYATLSDCQAKCGGGQCALLGVSQVECRTCR
jgi:hypothetical protein